ncbi:MAG: hypothetical protein WA154_11515 [Moraxellaceae bacterium]
MIAPLAFWHAGGSICARQAFLTDDDATAIIGVFRDEAKAAWQAGDYPAHAIAADLHGQLYTARLKAREWVSGRRQHDRKDA